ncbi:MAG TPA: NAD(P)(+) transhydrogenase (Re/Si-specific) subunit beta, partial [Polyangia bacterium]
MALLRELAVPILYIASAVLFILGLKQLCRVRSARRGIGLLSLGFVLALMGVAIEAAPLEPKLALAGLTVGTMMGLLVGFGTKTEVGAGVGPFFAAAGGIAAALVAVAAFLSDEVWPLGSAFAMEGGLRGAALGLAVLSGLAALVFGLLAAI